MLLNKIVIALAMVSLNVFAIETTPQIDCHSTKEFITTLNYLKGQKEFGIEEKKAIEISEKIAAGCDGAANRFIQTLIFLTDAEVPSKLAITSASNIALKTDQVFNNFTTIFKKIYVEKYFDLSASKSLKMASELTLDMEKDSSIVIEDFNTLGDFCLSSNGLDLGYDKCADFIFNTLQKSKTLNISISKDAIEFFDYLVKENKGPKLTVLNATTVIENTVEFGPTGVSNYKEAFNFASSTSGLSLSTKDSLKFANEMAKKTIKN